MAFESLTERLQGVFKNLRRKGKLSEKEVQEVTKEIRLALLEADVALPVVKTFIKRVRERAVGHEIIDTLDASQQIIKIVNEELTEILGSETSEIEKSPKIPTIIMMVGLQGAGKTTTSGKLGGYFKKQGKRPLLIACDIYRPAAIKQLQVVGEKLDIPVFNMGDKESPVNIAKAGLSHAMKNNHDLVIIDTAGRLHIDETLMDELKSIKSEVKPHEILLVVDSMTGQDAVNIAQTFNENVGIDGVVLTKLDGDTRGGAALSAKKVTGKPIKFVATGEKLNDIEVFNPERMTSRILGMGDVLSIIEKAEEAISEEDAEKLEKQLRKNELDLDDYLAQIRQVKKMGSFSSILIMIPGMNKIKDLNIVDNEFDKVEAIICSMTKQEKRNVKILNGSRRLRIAKGSGTQVQDVNKFINSFEMTQKMMKKFKNDKGSMRKMMKSMNMDDMKEFKDLKF